MTRYYRRLGGIPKGAFLAILVMGTVEFEPLVTFSCDDPNLCLTLAVIIHQALENMDHFISSRVEIFSALLLPEDNVRLLLLVSLRLHQAAVLHKFLHESVHFMIDLYGLQFGIFSSGLPPDFTVFEERTVLALLARRLLELFLDSGIRFGLQSFASDSAWPAPSLRMAFVGVEKPGC